MPVDATSKSGSRERPNMHRNPPKGEGPMDQPSTDEIHPNSPQEMPTKPESTVKPFAPNGENTEELKKSTLGMFFDYKIIDPKTVISQVQDLQDALHIIQAEGMVLSESFQVAAIIEKLPPSWSKFKNYLKRERYTEMKLEDLMVQLKEEEANRAYDENKQRKQIMEPKDLMVQLNKEEVNRASDEEKHGKEIIEAKANIVEKEKGANKRKRGNTEQGPNGGKSKKLNSERHV